MLWGPLFGNALFVPAVGVIAIVEPVVEDEARFLDAPAIQASILCDVSAAFTGNPLLDAKALAPCTRGETHDAPLLAWGLLRWCRREHGGSIAECAKMSRIIFAVAIIF